MTAAAQSGPITATPAAREALERLRRQHGDIILHITGGWSKAPLCLQAGDLRLGARDILIGSVDGIPVYEMQITPEVGERSYGYVLELVGEAPMGFSLDPGQGLRFAMREVPLPS
jgi:uncharacterized protein (DUF779 family)